MIVGQNVFDKQVRNNLITHHSILKNATSEGDDYTAGGLLY